MMFTIGPLANSIDDAMNDPDEAYRNLGCLHNQLAFHITFHNCSRRCDDARKEKRKETEDGDSDCFFSCNSHFECDPAVFGQQQRDECVRKHNDIVVDPTTTVTARATHATVGTQTELGGIWPVYQEDPEDLDTIDQRQDDKIDDISRKCERVTTRLMKLADDFQLELDRVADGGNGGGYFNTSNRADGFINFFLPPLRFRESVGNMLQFLALFVPSA